MSKIVKPGEIIMDQCGTPAYIAPEIILSRGYEGYAADIWSTGVVLYAMIYGTVPFKAKSMMELNELIINAKFTMQPCASEEVRNLISRMLEPNPKKRISIPEIFCHKWFSTYDPNVILLSEKEKERIKKDFSNASKRNNGISNTSMTSDWFVDQDIDHSLSELSRNVSSKSIILAPYNSSFTGNSDEMDDSEVSIYEGRAIKLGPKVKDFDKQYEKNYNCEVDNGILNEADEESSLNPLQSCNDSFENLNSDTQKRIQEMLLQSLVQKVMVIDKKIINDMRQFGYPEEYVVRCLEKEEKNYATATYFLLSNQ